MLDKLEFLKRAREELTSLEVAIKGEDRKLEQAYEELTRLRNYKVIHELQ